MQRNDIEPFTRPEALAKGITVHQLAGPRYHRLFHGLYLPAGVRVTVVDRARAALKISPPQSFASHHTAALIWGGCVPETSQTHVSVVNGLPRTRRQGISAHRALADTAPLRQQGLLVSPPLQTFLELAAAGLDLVDLVVLGDSLVKAKRFTPEALRDTTSSWGGSGGALARRAARLVRNGVDSPPESRLRMLIVLAGLPEPQVNIITRLVGGSWSRRFDLCYPELKLIVEYEGRQHAQDSEQWSSDILRREKLEAQGWRLIIVNAEALYNHPSDTLSRIRSALEQCDSPHLPRRVPDAWMRHFVDRVRAA